MVHDNKVDQSRASAQGDNIGRDKNTAVYNYRPSKIDGLVQKLKLETECGSTITSTIAALQYYLSPVAPDGISGLEAKLNHSGRADQLTTALREKELFVKFLERWSHYASAQELFAYLLPAIEQRFTTYLSPHVEALTKAAFDALVYEKIIVPVMDEIGDEPLGINHTVLSGMIYWLAEQCFVRWHS